MTDVPAPQDDATAPAAPPPYSFSGPTAAARSARLGRVAMIMAVCVIVLSLTASVLIGMFATTVYHYDSLVTGSGGVSGRVGFNAVANPLAAGIHIGLGTIFGVWALIQGIIATAQNRGRRFGVVAIVLAGAAPILSLIVFTVVGSVAGHNVYQ